MSIRRITLGLLLICNSSAATVDPLTLIDVDGNLADVPLEFRDTNPASIPARPGGALVVSSGHSIQWPGFTIFAPDGHWDLSEWQRISTTITNVGDARLEVGLRIDGPGADEQENRRVQVVGDIAPGDSLELTANLLRTPWTLEESFEIVGMRAAPGQATIDAAHVEKIIIFIARPDRDHRFLVGDLTLHGRAEPLDVTHFFPFIDRYGQFVHVDWPGKIHADEDFARNLELEATELSAQPSTADRSRFGGWSAGPRFEATGYFRPLKHEGHWWLVDPEGYLFWSHGIDCVNTNYGTGLPDRETYYADLPASDDPLGQFYGQSTWGGANSYYSGRTPFRTYNHRQANLWRKYGADWPDDFADLAHQRLRSWGFNTIANWSDPAVYLQRRTPYAAAVWIGAPQLEGSQGYWRKFHDVYDPGFRQTVREALATRQTEATDPWCIGFFVDNELAWGDETNLGTATLLSPPQQAAKQVFIGQLRAQYGTIDALNAAWSTRHASWQALTDHREAPPETAGSRADLIAFTDSTARTYFRTIKQELAALAPEQLYLGVRFAWQNDVVVRAAIDYCDVVSFNRYQYSIADVALPDDADHPIIIGEFHFGATDRGMFHPGLRAARDQAHRGELYADYVRGALTNPLIVGTHWFQYGDQSTTGRGDGENYNIGFLSIADVPYPKMVEAARDVGAQMYSLRSGTHP
ncbi:MAG: beta-agarase [Gemmatimonadetes bacterium]|nr:beta-agarase [Gemmatimonadota bacterium]MBT7862043.1 beta-agarase [Gemmatimonadota bacterium]